MEERNDKWLADINCLAEELPRRHINLFFQYNKEQFEENIEELKRNMPKLHSLEIAVEIAKIVANIGDGHTSAMLQVSKLLPIEVYWFSEGLYIISALGEYKTLENLKITAVNDIEINRVIEDLSSIISYENEYFLKAQLPKFFPAIELLYGLAITDSLEYIELTLEAENGELKKVDVKAYDIKKFREERAKIDRGEEQQLHEKNSELCYWFEFLESYNTLYFKYNACKENLDKNIASFTEELISFMEEKSPDKFIIDLRNNYGGNSLLLKPFMGYLEISRAINRKGHLFVITGRETFSSALLNIYTLKNTTKATFVGEPTGGKPNCYGEVESFKLENSGITICYSTKYFQVIEDSSIMSFVPDKEIQVSFYDFVKKEDPCLEYIIK